MSDFFSHFSRKQKVKAVIAVTIGNFLEWYEIFLFVYWAPIISKLFFAPTTNFDGLIYTLFLFALGFLARPFGGLFFGRLGDRIGRKKSLIFSILAMTFPTFVMGLLPTYEHIGIFAPITLGFMRLLQAFPAGGELPGAACYLYESSPWQTRRFLCSWASWGYQLGILASTAECYLLESFLPMEDLMAWGWRISFLVGGVIGLLGLCLRSQLHETTLYREMVTHEKVVKTSLLEVLRKYAKRIVKGFLYCALNCSAFYFITVSFPFYIESVLDTEKGVNLITTIVLILILTLPLPFFGMLGDRCNNKKILIWSTIGVILTIYPLYLAVHAHSIAWMIVTMVVFSLFVACLSALLPYILVDLFPTHERFTCSAVSFNLSDAIIGGFTPVTAFFLLARTQDIGSIIWILLFSAALSLGSFFFVKDHHPVE
jgi:MFS transporter, MHS family, proline/betaine transporter